MPLYEYTCDKCHATIELLRKMSDADAEAICESCGSTNLKRRHSTFAARGSEGRSDVPLPMSAPRCGCGNPQGPCNMG